MNSQNQYWLIYTGNNVHMLDDVKKRMMKEFDISDLGPMHYFLGIKVVQLAAGSVFDLSKQICFRIVGMVSDDKL